MDARDALDRIRDEMAAKPDNGAIQAIGQMMTAKLEAEPELSEKVMAKGKTLEGAYKALEDYARSNRAGKNCVYVPPEKAMEIVAEYYGMDAAVLQQCETKMAPPAAKPQQKEETKAHAEPDDLDLDALLGL